MENQFGSWLLEHIQRRSNWNQSTLAGRAGVSKTAINDVITGKRKAGFELCKGIAKALEVDEIIVLRAAGLLPPAAELTPLMERAVFYLSHLDPEDQERVVLYLEVLYSRYKYGGERP